MAPLPPLRRISILDELQLEPAFSHEFLAIRVPHFHFYNGRLVRYSDGRVIEIWSPNSYSLPYFPGQRDPDAEAIDFGTMPEEGMRRTDGSWGRYDATTHPQFYDPLNPWQPFVCPIPTNRPPGPCQETFSDVFTIENYDQRSGQVEAAYYTRLVARLREVEDDYRTLPAVQEMLQRHQHLRKCLPSWPTEDELQALKGKIEFSFALDVISLVQRKLRVFTAMSHYLQKIAVLPRHTLQTMPLDFDRRNPLPMASSNYIGVFANNMPLPAIVWMAQYARVPLYFVYELSRQEISALRFVETLGPLKATPYGRYLIQPSSIPYKALHETFGTTYLPCRGERFRDGAMQKQPLPHDNARQFLCGSKQQGYIGKPTRNAGVGNNRFTRSQFHDENLIRELRTRYPTIAERAGASLSRVGSLGRQEWSSSAFRDRQASSTSSSLRFKRQVQSSTPSTMDSRLQWGSGNLTWGVKSDSTTPSTGWDTRSSPANSCWGSGNLTWGVKSDSTTPSTGWDTRSSPANYCWGNVEELTNRWDDVPRGDNGGPTMRDASVVAEEIARLGLNPVNHPPPYTPKATRATIVRDRWHLWKSSPAPTSRPLSDLHVAWIVPPEIPERSMPTKFNDHFILRSVQEDSRLFSEEDESLFKFYFDAIGKGQDEVKETLERNKYYDRILGRTVHFSTDGRLVRPIGYISNEDVFGLPCPHYPYVSRHNDRLVILPQTSWMYRTPSAESRHRGISASEPTLDQLPRLSIVPPNLLHNTIVWEEYTFRISGPFVEDGDDDEDDDNGDLSFPHDSHLPPYDEHSNIPPSTHDPNPPVAFEDKLVPNRIVGVRALASTAEARFDEDESTPVKSKGKGKDCTSTNDEEEEQSGINQDPVPEAMEVDEETSQVLVDDEGFPVVNQSKLKSVSEGESSSTASQRPIPDSRVGSSTSVGLSPGSSSSSSIGIFIADLYPELLELEDRALVSILPLPPSDITPTPHPIVNPCLNDQDLAARTWNRVSSTTEKTSSEASANKRALESSRNETGEDGRGDTAVSQSTSGGSGEESRKRQKKSGSRTNWVRKARRRVLATSRGLRMAGFAVDGKYNYKVLEAANIRRIDDLRERIIADAVAAKAQRGRRSETDARASVSHSPNQRFRNPPAMTSSEPHYSLTLRLTNPSSNNYTPPTLAESTASSGASSLLLRIRSSDDEDEPIDCPDEDMESE